MSDLVHFNPVRAWDRNGVAAPGALAKFYEPGTTTPRVVYSDADLTVPHGAAGAALKADGRGVFAPVFTSGPIKVVITDAAGVTLPGGTLDPAPTISSDSAGAGSVSFTPTGPIPVSNVQDAIEAVDENWRDQLAALGLGITGTAPLLGNFDATNIPSGAVFRFNTTPGNTLGTPAPDWASITTGPFVFLRRNSTHGISIAAATVDGILWTRALHNGIWGSWTRVNARTLAQALWDAGTDTTEATITPAKLRGAFNAGGSAPVYACRAWVNFNGSGTVAIRASGNVSSITDNGTGDYTVNFTVPLPDADYAIVGTLSRPDGNAGSLVTSSATVPTASAVRILSIVGLSTAFDPQFVSVSVFR